MNQPSGKLRAMVCEDEGLTVLMLRQSLIRAGYEVAGETDNGARAVEMAKSLQPDFILMDINLPGMNGIEAMRNIVNERPVPIIMLTAYSDSLVVEKAISAGACAYIVKPIVGEQLGPAVKTALARFDTMESIQKENVDLKDALETRKLVERAKGILIDRMKLGEAEAFRKLQKISRDKCQTMKQTASEIIQADAVFQHD